MHKQILPPGQCISACVGWVRTANVLHIFFNIQLLD